MRNSARLVFVVFSTSFASLLALSVGAAYAQTTFGKWTLLQPVNAAPKATLAFPTYADVARVELICERQHYINIKVFFKNGSRPNVHVGGDVDAPGNLLRLDNANEVILDEQGLFVKRLKQAEVDAAQLKAKNPGVPVTAEIVIGDTDVDIGGFTTLLDTLKTECENYLKANPTPVAAQPTSQTPAGPVNLKSFDAAARAVQSAFAPGECKSFLTGGDLGGGPEVRCKLQLNKTISGMTSPGMQAWVQANEPYSRPNKTTKVIAIFMDQYGFLPQNRGAAIDRILKVANALGAKDPGQISGAFNNGGGGDPQLDGAPRVEFNCQNLYFCRMFIAP